MKNRLVFHYLFTLWMSYFAISGILYLMLVPFNISTWFQTILTDQANLLYYEDIVTNIVQCALGVLAIPIVYSLLHRVNLNLKKMNIFLWTYWVSRIILRMMDGNIEFITMTPLPQIILFILEIIFTYFMIQVILDYYADRAHLFSTESKEFKRAKFKANLNRLTFGIISFER